MEKTGIYLHIPFCEKKCDYCDFLSRPANIKTQNQYGEALLREIENTEIDPGTEIDTIFIGGGTPSILSEEWIYCFLAGIRERYPMPDSVEITIEANPGTLSEEKLRMYRKAGINRLSIGLQSGDNDELAMLGRIHTYEEFLEGYRQAREMGFDNINIDLMMALPGQRKGTWLETIKKVLLLRPEHISAYSLIIEPGTPFYERELSLPNEEEERAMYEEGRTLLREWGYHQYEISNFAKPGKECEHNIGYWKRKPYLGMGLGAASLYREKRYRNTSDLNEYLQNSDESSRIRRDEETLTEREQMEEFMFLGLRMLQGISKEDFHRCFQSSIYDIYGDVIQKHTQLGLLEDIKGQLRLTDRGISLSNQVMADFLL